MSTSVTLAVTHLELQELKQQLGERNVSLEEDVGDPGKAYEPGLILATFVATAPSLTALAGWLWSQRKAGRMVEETFKVKNTDGSTMEHTVKYKATNPKNAISEILQILRSFFTDLGDG
jgi:hypothetical protein